MTGTLPPLRTVRPLDQLRERLRYVHYSLSTERAYVRWVRAFVRFHGIRHPREMGGPEVETFLAWIANQRNVSVSTHEQALSALLFLYKHVLSVDLPWMQQIGRPITPQRIPVVMSRAEVQRLLAATSGCITWYSACCTAPACERWSAYGCVSRIRTSTGG